MYAHLQVLAHGTSGLEFAYALVWAALLVGLVRKRAPWAKLSLSPLLAVPVMLFAALLLSLMNRLLPGSASNDVSLLQFGFGVLVLAAIGYAAGRLLAVSRPSADATHLRGAIVSTAPPISARSATRITLAGIPVAPEDETKHFKIIGTTGTGKSTAIREMLSAALARGDRAIIADPDGGYLSRFYDTARGDVILNPFDGDAQKWDLFGEITNDYDVELLARSLIPDSGESDRAWCEYARTFFSAVAQQTIAGTARNDYEFYRILTSVPAEELRLLLAGTAAGPFLEPGNEKMFGSVRSIASSAVRALQYTTRQQAAPFSVRQWVRQGAARSNGGQGGVLFFPYKAGEIAALRSVISAWMRIAIFEAMDRDEGDQRLWFVIDELDALGEIDGLKDALARLRKFGGRCVLGFQSIAQVSGTYGKGIAETIIENCGTTLILRCSASERGGTSEFASKLIGQREVVHTTLSTTRRPSEWLASTTSSQHLRIEPAVMASEIERLPDFAGFLKLASIPDWQAVKLAPVSEPAPVRKRSPSIVASPANSPALRTAVRKPARQRKAAQSRADEAQLRN
ncbi:MAG: type IV secretion system DNA-binding domain-containing protein [Steroidobacteraceae bacterium]